MRRLVALLLLLATAAVPAAASARSATDTVPAPRPVLTHVGRTPLVELGGDAGGLPVLGASGPYNAGNWEDALRTYHDSGVYARQLRQVGTLARRWVRRQAHQRAGHRLALVLDIDETSLSNYTAIQADNFTFGPNSAGEAVNQVGRAIAPTLGLYRAARARRVAVFFITGRSEAVRAPTEANLRREGYTRWRGLRLKPTGFTGTTVAYKSAARAAIARRGFRIIANVGDQYSDLAGGHALRAFKYANPFYFLP